MYSLMLTYCPICIKKKQTIKPAEPLNQYWSATHQKLVWSLDIKMWCFCHIARIFSSLLLRSMESCCFRFPFVKV